MELSKYDLNLQRTTMGPYIYLKHSLYKLRLVSFQMIGKIQLKETVYNMLYI